VWKIRDGPEPELQLPRNLEDLIFEKQKNVKNVVEEQISSPE